MLKNQNAGHLMAMLTVFLWGTTFISTKVLLSSSYTGLSEEDKRI